MDRFQVEESNMFTVEVYLDDGNLYSYTAIVEEDSLIGFENIVSDRIYSRRGEYGMGDPFYQKGYTYDGYVVVDRYYFK